MPIPVACKCGQKFAAKDSLAGKAVKCPKCGTPLKIPVPKSKQAAAKSAAKPRNKQAGSMKASAPAQAQAPTGGLGGLLDEAGFKAEPQHAGPKCPNCNAPIQTDAILCVECGFNLETGRKMGSVKQVKKADRPLTEAEKMVAKAAEEIKDTPISAGGQKFGTGVEAYIFFFGLLILTAIGGIGVYIYLQAAAKYANVPWFMIATVAGVLLMVAWIQIVSRAFADKFTHGMASLLLPPYTVAYAMVRSVSLMGPVVLGLVGLNLMVISWMLAQKASGGTFLMIAMVCADVWFIAAARVVGMAFEEEEEGQKQGLLCLLVPLYKYIYGFMKRDRYLVWTVVTLIAGVSALIFFVLSIVESGSS